MYARIGPSRARGFHVAAEQHAQGILEVALHGGLTRLTSEAAERRAVVRQGQSQGVVAHGLSAAAAAAASRLRAVFGVMVCVFIADIINEHAPSAKRGRYPLAKLFKSAAKLRRIARCPPSEFRASRRPQRGLRASEDCLSDWAMRDRRYEALHTCEPNRSWISGRMTGLRESTDTGSSARNLRPSLCCTSRTTRRDPDTTSRCG